MNSIPGRRAARQAASEPQQRPFARSTLIRNTLKHGVNFARLLTSGDHAYDHGGEYRMFAQGGRNAFASLDVTCGDRDNREPVQAPRDCLDVAREARRFEPVLQAVEAYARDHNVPRDVAMDKARRYAHEIVPSFSAALELAPYPARNAGQGPRTGLSGTWPTPG